MDNIESLYLEGLSLVKVAKELGISKNKVHKRIKELGIQRDRLDSSRESRSTGISQVNIFDPEDLYWLGVISADGSIVGNKISLQLKDKYHVEKFKVWSKSSNKIQYDKRASGSWIMRFSRKSLIDQLRNLGITERKSKTIAVTKELSSSNHFWRGVIDGDGWVLRCRPTQRLNIGVCSASKDFIGQYIEFLKANEIEPKSVGITKSGVFRTENTGKVAKSVGDLIYRESSESTRLSRKYEVFMNG